MPDPKSRKRLKKKMLDRWENEGGKIAADTATSDDAELASENKGHRKKLPFQRDNSSVGPPASPTKRRKP